MVLYENRIFECHIIITPVFFGPWAAPSAPYPLSNTTHKIIQSLVPSCIILRVCTLYRVNPKP